MKYIQSFGSNAVKEWPNVAFQWVVLQLSIREFSGSNIDPETCNLD
jgi:hypothetical protein